MNLHTCVMTESIPKTTSQWNVVGTDGLASLKRSEQSVPELGDNQVLVKLQAASLNFRDLVVSRGQYPYGFKDNVIPGSDGAGTVLAVGKHVTRFAPGDKVITMLLQAHIAGPPTEANTSRQLGATVDGTFRTLGVFDEQGLVKMPEGLSFTEAATLGCAGLTAWNALFGGGRPLSAGQWLLTQGTGGVSLFAVQFAKAVGARVISTTSAAEKAEVLRKLGADHVVNYREKLDWGDEAKRLTGGVGVDLVVDITGPSGLEQSVKGLRLDGIVAVVGAIAGFGGDAKVPTILDSWVNLFTSRGVWVGNRVQMEDMCRAIEGNIERLRPVLDSKVFKLEELKEAYEYLEGGKYLGKICIEIY
ncbi:putative alcohol dehydrogenase [Xylaria cf. heliscus]|nr:putative alcohol dehydrogenase [Xylaria cf. heliscus]